MGVSELTKGKIVKCQEAIKHSGNILDNMAKNKDEYNTKDLCWRLLELTDVMFKTFEIMVDAVSNIAVIEEEKPEDEEDEEVKKENEDDQDDQKDQEADEDKTAEVEEEEKIEEKLNEDDF